MSWSYLPEEEAESTEACCSDTLPSALWKSLTTTAGCCCSDSETESSRDSRSGTTCAPSTVGRGEDMSTSCREDSPARTFQPPEKAPESTARSPDSGAKWRASFARFDRATSSWRTVQCSLFEDSAACSVTWPRSGMTVAGLAYPLPTAGRRTSGIGFGFWRTPLAADGQARPRGKFDSNGCPQLSAQVLLRTPKASDADKSGRGELLHKIKTGLPRGIPTPRANDAKKTGNIDPTNPRNGLAGFVRMPTPASSDWKGSSKPGQRRGQLTDPEHGVIPTGGRLNPEFVEWLMGWPIGSTALSPLEMDKYHEFEQQHGGF